MYRIKIQDQTFIFQSYKSHSFAVEKLQLIANDLQRDDLPDKRQLEFPLYKPPERGKSINPLYA